LEVDQPVPVSEAMTGGLGFQFNHFGLVIFSLFGKSEVQLAVYFD